MKKPIKRKILKYGEFKKVGKTVQEPKVPKMKDEGVKEGISESLDKETVERMEGLSNTKELKQFNELLALLAESWFKEGFDREDVMDYVNEQISLLSSVSAQHRSKHT